MDLGRGVRVAGMGWRALWRYWTEKGVGWLRERGCSGGLGVSRDYYIGRWSCTVIECMEGGGERVGVEVGVLVVWGRD